MDQNISRGSDLAILLQSGNTSVFPKIMECYKHRVYAIGFHITNSCEDAEDITQETFIQMLEKIGQWHGDNFEGWLFQIARNRSIDYVRKRHKIKEYHVPDSSPANDELLRQENRNTVNSIIRKLPEKQRDILYLRHFQGYSIKEIAGQKHCAEGTVKATLFYVFQKLKRKFENAGLME